MSNEQALLNCTFGWGKTCCLYYDSLEIAGKSYNLRDLTSIQPSYRTVFGVSSARLELSFGLDRLVLRGIGDLDIARLMVSHLQSYCSTSHLAAHKGSRSSRSRNLARVQAKAWERTNKLPAILDIPEAIALSTSTSDTLKCARAESDKSGFAEEQPDDQLLSLDAVPKAPVEDTSLTPSETLEAFAQLANNLSTYASPLPTALWQPPHTPRFQPPLHSVHLIPPNQKFDSNSIPVPAIKSSVLPIIHVPVRLQHGECAHYSIGATLCSDRIAKSARATYPLLDQGLLVLTNRRVLYIGKRCQFTLAYTHLWYVSLLHTAIALHIEGQFRRIIIELEHPQEWASRIELLAFIARRARPRSETPTVAVTAIPGLNMTVKRKAVKAAAKKASADDPTILLPGGRIVESRIVEAETIEFKDEALEACANHATLDFPATPETVESTEQTKRDQSEISEQSTRSPLPIDESAQPRQLENAPTRAFPAKRDVATLATQEFSLASLQPESDMANRATQEFSLASLQDEDDTTLKRAAASRSELANMATREFSLVSQQVAEEKIPGQAAAREPDLANMATREFSLSSLQPEPEKRPGSYVPSKPDVANMATREFSLPPQRVTHSKPLRADEAHGNEKKARSLQADQAKIARLQAEQPPDEQPEMTTSALLYDPALPLAARARNESAAIEDNTPSTQELDDDDDRTIHLYERKLCQLRTVPVHEPVSDRLPDIKPAKRRPLRVRVPQRPL